MLQSSARRIGFTLTSIKERSRDNEVTLGALVFRSESNLRGPLEAWYAFMLSEQQNGRRASSRAATLGAFSCLFSGAILGSDHFA